MTATDKPRTFHQAIASGMAHFCEGRLPEAEASFRGILAVDPDNVTALERLGHIAVRTGRHPQALEFFYRALQGNPGNAAMHFNLGTVFQSLSKPSEALACYLTALDIDPEHAAASDHAGVVLRLMDKSSERLRDLRAPRLKPVHAEAYKKLGVALAGLGKWDAALECFRKALHIDPTYADGHICVGNVMLAQDRPDEAAACFRKALSLGPNSAIAHNNLGSVLQKLGRAEEALACIQKALALVPDFADAHNNLGIALQDLGKVDLAEDRYRRALQLNPHFSRAQCNLATALLLRGKLAAGFALYENRFEGADRNQVAMSRQTLATLAAKPRWQGEDLRGRAIFLWREQGFGDGIMMLRYLPLMQERGAGEIMVSCRPALRRLLQQMPAVGRVIDDQDPLPVDEFACHCPIMSLPYLFGTRLETIPNAVPYLRVPSGMAEKWVQRLAPLCGLKVGLAWAGSRTQRRDFLRSISFARLAPLLAVTGVQFISLQKEEAAAADMVLDWMAECEDFLDTAALMRQLDLVISVDTAVAHLAGALGKPVWLLNRFEGDWRWMLEREDSPWYPTLRIFRQPVPRDWDSVLARVAGELQRLAAGRAGD